LGGIITSILTGLTFFSPVGGFKKDYSIAAPDSWMAAGYFESAAKLLVKNVLGFFISVGIDGSVN